MSDTSLYDDLIMDHIRNARNYRVLEDADRTASGTNPLCGDEMRVSVKLEGERIAEVAFQCTCCGISMASASMMTGMVQGLRADDAKALVREFVGMVTSRSEPSSQTATAERRAMLDTVRRFPARTRCAALPWATLEGALDDHQRTVVVR